MASIVSVVGPTASGKTALGIALAKQLGAHVISMDSMQIYQKMDIGTAKVKPEEMMGVPHHMIDIASPAEKYSVRQFVEKARGIVDELLKQNISVVLVGGTGLYLDHLIRDTRFAEVDTDEHLRVALSQKSARDLYDELAEVDPSSAARLHPNDKKRVTRALEIYLTSGKTATYWNEKSHCDSRPLDVVMIGLSYSDRETLYERIDKRVDKMISLGLEQEVRSLLSMDGFLHSTAAKAIGYKEMILYLQGEITLESAVLMIKQNTRRYAKRQLTWFRHETDIHWLEADRPFDRILADALAVIKE